MSTILSPFVYKVKGKKNYLLFDSIKKGIFCISPEGNPQELERQLLENDLVINTEGVVPFKYKPNVKIYKSYLILKELQIRITGKCDFNCDKCGEIGKCIKDNTEISRYLVNNLADQLRSFKVENLTIIGGNPFLEIKILEMIKTSITALNYKVLCPSIINGHVKKEVLILEEMGFVITNSVCNIGDISEENMSTDVNEFFYNQQFNPCWGNKLAINTNGEIRPCLWSEKNLGNLMEVHLANLILSKKCDELWELTKDKIDVCKGCEFRYSCFDCRVMSEKVYGNLLSKTFDCSYCPGSGTWKR